MSFTLGPRTPNFEIYTPRRMNRWRNMETGEVVMPVSRINGSIWVRTHKDGSKRNFSPDSFFDTFEPDAS